MGEELQNNNSCKNCLERAKLYFSYFKRCADEEGKYTSIVFSLGYATMITVYSSLHKYLVTQKKAVFICFLAVSLSVFILNEIWKMIMGALANRYEADLWSQYFKKEITVEDIELKAHKYKAQQYKWYSMAYPAIFVLSLIFGLLAAALLFIEAICLTF